LIAEEATHYARAGLERISAKYARPYASVQGQHWLAVYLTEGGQYP
jgi:hypothetical protein